MIKANKHSHRAQRPHGEMPPSSLCLCVSVAVFPGGEDAMSRHLVIMAAGTGDTSFQASPWLRKCSDEAGRVLDRDRARLENKPCRAKRVWRLMHLAFSGMRGKGLGHARGV